MFCTASLHCLPVLPCTAESLDRNHLNFQTIRPADYPTPYAAMLKNNIQFSAMDRKAGRMSTLMVSPCVTMRLLGRRCRVLAAGGCWGADAGCWLLAAAGAQMQGAGCSWLRRRCRVLTPAAVQMQGAGGSSAAGFVLHAG